MSLPDSPPTHCTECYQFFFPEDKEQTVCFGCRKVAVISPSRAFMYPAHPVQCCQCGIWIHKANLAIHAGTDLTKGWVCSGCIAREGSSVPTDLSPSFIKRLADAVEDLKMRQCPVRLDEAEHKIDCLQTKLEKIQPQYEWAMQEIRRLGDAMAEMFTPEQRGEGTNVDQAIRVIHGLVGCTEQAETTMQAALGVKEQATALLTGMVSQYELAAQRYGLAMKARRFRVAVMNPHARAPGHEVSAVYELELPDRGPHYLAVIRATTEEALDPDLLNANVQQIRSRLPAGCHLIITSPGTELAVVELVAVDPLPYDAVRRFPAFVETRTCGRCGLTADQNWAGWHARAQAPDCNWVCAHCWTSEVTNEQG